MGTITTSDGSEIFYKDWGQWTAHRVQSRLAAVVRRLGCAVDVLRRARLSGHRPRPPWPRAIHPDRRRTRHGSLRRRHVGRGRTHLDLHDAVHVGHSTGGGEVARYMARHGESRAAKAVLISSVPPLMLKTEANPGGLPKEVFDGFQVQVATNRAQFYRDLPEGPFYGFNRPGVKPIAGIIRQLVAPGHDGRRQGALRRHRRLLADRLHRGPEEDHGAGARDARRRRPDRPLRRLRAAVCRAPQERDAQDL